MARKYTGGTPLNVGFNLITNRPIDERDIVSTKDDLKTATNCYAGQIIKVEDENYLQYQWNGVNQTDLDNWNLVQGEGGGGGTGDGDMLKSVYDTNNNNIVDNSEKLGNQLPSAYMTKATYDSNTNGKVDDSDKLGGKLPSEYLQSTDLDGYMAKSVYDVNDNGIVDDSEKLAGQTASYYDQGQALTDHVGDDQVHLSTDERAAIDNSPNPPTAGNAFATQDDLAAGGNGDMLISVYGGSDANTVRNSDKLQGVEASALDQSAHVADVTTNPHNVDKAAVGLSLVDNTSDIDKPISTATQTELDTKVTDIVAGVGISVDATTPSSPIVSVSSTTTAGVLTRVYYTGDEVTTTSGTYYLTNGGGKGTIPNVQQTVSPADDTKLYYPEDALGDVIGFNTQLYAGTYAGALSVEVDEDDRANRFTIEIYLADSEGVVIDSGITGAPIGDLGVKVITILDTGVVEFKKDEVTQIECSGVMLENVEITSTQRIRHHFSAAKVGASGKVQAMTLYFGSDHNSYLDTPVTLLTSDILNDSDVAGTTAKDAFNSLNTTVGNPAQLDQPNEFTDTNTFPRVDVDAQGQVAFVVGAQTGQGGQPYYMQELISASQVEKAWVMNSSNVPLVASNLLTPATIEAFDTDETGFAPYVTREYLETYYTKSPDVRTMLKKTQAEYDALTPDANTFYIITDA